jgi:LPS-assembly protein
LLYAQIQQVELLANSVVKNGDLIEAQGDVLVYSERYVITADKGVYNQTTGDLKLFGNVSLLRGEHESTQSEEVSINLRTDEGEYIPFFFYDQRSDLWMQCDSALSGPLYFMSKNAITSSCNVQNPDWKISFSEGRLNRETSFIHLYNTLFHVGDIPVFYLPYFAFSTDKTRRTGLLVPKIAIGAKEGLFYEQPIYFAPQENWDLELNPQIRTNRGHGLYATLRFVDSLQSQGSITTGIFNEKSDYVRKENLKNDTHYGLEVDYERSQLISHLLDEKAEDGLWIEGVYLNDVDYLNMKSDSEKPTHGLATSRINYYLAKDYDYLGLYSKYYIDTRKTSNRTTLQELPTLHYHRFSNNFFLPNLLYTLDAQFHNYTRQDGVSARQYEVSLPIAFYTSFWDDFLHVSVSENFYFTHVRYDDRIGDLGETFYRNFHKIDFYTDLARAYPSFYHALYGGFDYTVPSFDHGAITEDFITTKSEYESINAKLVQYFYDSSGNKRLRHSMRQPYNMEKGVYKYGDFENSISYYMNQSTTLKNEFKYSHEFKRFSKLQSSIEWDGGDYDFNLNHTMIHEDQDPKKSYLMATFDTRLGKYYNLFARVNYNIEDHYTNMWELGVKVARKCWDYSFVYKEVITSKLTSAGSDSVSQKGFFIMFNLYPIGAVEYEHTLEETR